MKAIRLKTEYLTNPVGIDIIAPRLFWNCEGGKSQSAYQIIARRGDETVWDTGKTVSGSMTHIPYRGKHLNSRDRVCWRVRLWDENDSASDWSEEAFFELGLLLPSDWKAQWITGNYQVDKRKRYPVDCFRRNFSAEQIVSARLYITAAGVYEAKINGSRVGDFILAPGITDYKKRIQYQTYDVTGLLKDGDNQITVQLADGWYRGSTGAWGLRNQYGVETKLLAQLELTGNNGNTEVIFTDNHWNWSNDGPVRFADNKNGERINADFCPSYGEKAKETECKVTPTASNNVPVTEHEHFLPEVIVTPSGKTVLDFGQNIAGYISFRLNGKKGQRVFLRFGEMLDENGEFTQKNIQLPAKEGFTPLQQVEYLCKDGLNEYKTSFAIFGFRYVLLDTDVPWNQMDFVAIAVYSDLEQTGFFYSSNTLLNQFVENTIWSAKGNFADIPTDCPTRERHGWTGDAQIFCKTASYLFDFAPFATKFIQDIYDWQEKNGRLPQIVPPGGVDFYMDPLNGSVGWADAGVLMPYILWEMYGDRGILERNYESMKKYAAFMQRRCGRKTPLSRPLRLHGKERQYAVNYGQSYGEWAEPEDVHPNRWTDMVLPHPEESTAYTCFVMQRMAEIAQTLGKKADAQEYRLWENNVRNSYQALSKLPAFTLDSCRQARLVRPLYMKLLDKGQTEYARKRLVRVLEDYGWRLGTGFLSTPLILSVLTEIDSEFAYRLLENEEMPGWLFMPKNGATTVWESWEGTQSQGSIASLNHYSKGACVEWLFSTMCGIRIAGENHFIIEPVWGGHFTHAKASYQSIYGRVVSSWKRVDSNIVYEITVPTNCTADIRLSGGRTEIVSSGTYTYEEAI